MKILGIFRKTKPSITTELKNDVQILLDKMNKETIPTISQESGRIISTNILSRLDVFEKEKMVATFFDNRYLVRPVEEGRLGVGSIVAPNKGIDLAIDTVDGTIKNRFSFWQPTKQLHERADKLLRHIINNYDNKEVVKKSSIGMMLFNAEKLQELIDIGGKIAKKAKATAKIHRPDRIIQKIREKIEINHKAVK